MDSPDQGAIGMKIPSTTYENNELVISMPAIGLTYKGALSDDGQTIAGTFGQSGFSTSLDLTKVAAEEATVTFVRPQEPKPPFPYISEDVFFDNPNANARLAGTFTKPAGSGVFPTIVLISGSGQQDRNQEVFGHKPF